MDAIDQQISDVAGITRQREGQIRSNDAVTNAQQNIIQSSTITEAAYFQPHAKLWENILNSSIEVTQACWASKDKVIKQYVLDDGTLQVLDVRPQDITNHQFAIYLTDSMKEAQVFEMMRQLAQPLIQNDKARMSDVIKILKATSANQLEEQIKHSERKLDRQQQQEQQFQQEMQQQQIEAQRQLQEDIQLHEKELALLEGELKVKVEEMKLSVDNQKDSLEAEKIMADIENQKEKLELEKKKLEQQKEIELKKIKAQKSRSNAS